MSVTDVKESLCWWQIWDVGDQLCWIKLTIFWNVINLIFVTNIHMDKEFFLNTSNCDQNDLISINHLVITLVSFSVKMCSQGIDALYKYSEPKTRIPSWCDVLETCFILGIGGTCISSSNWISKFVQELFF